MASPSTEVEKKWQERWYAAKINESEADQRRKFMMIFAYPGVTGYLHVGHMRGYTYVDAITRYMRMVGYNTLFPVGTHATGNGAISLAKRIKSGDRKTIEYLTSNGCPEEKLRELTEPYQIIDFFNDVYLNQYWKRFGFLADWRRFTCTIFPDYGKFIQWQFKKLMENGLLVQKPYYAAACVECGPVAIDASETDLQKGGTAEMIEYTLLKFKCGELILVAATLRPETVYGQTNFWVHPDIEYAKVEHDGETWVISGPAYDKMRYQRDDLEMVGTIAGRDLVGRTCIAPVIHREIPVLPATFVSPTVGTGLVTSVPSDAPDDWIALKNLQDDEVIMAQYGLDRELVISVKPIPIIDTKGWGPMPAVEIVERMGITRTGDARLDDAKKIVYKEGFHTGRMNANCAEFAGIKVEEAKELIKAMMLKSGEADTFFDLSEEVVCRCGKPVVIKKVPDQWFIDYANPHLTEKSMDHARAMHIMPQEYYQNIQGVLDWFRERACVRQGNWLGTRFPFDDKWIIEAISDSTLYPIYYLVSKYVNEGLLDPEQLTESFFDYVYLGRGKSEGVCAEIGAPEALLQRIQQDVRYWYPLDINLGGKEHMTVHFPAFLKNHVAILPPELWPRGIFVNWYVTGKLGKISKSKGGAEPIPDAAERFGVDPMRLYYSHVASPFADVEWDEEAVVNYRSRMERIVRTIEELKSLPLDVEESSIDRWLLSRINGRIRSIREGMADLDLRRMANEVYFEIPNDLRWYARRGGKNGKAAARLLEMWIRMMAPITPHTAEEAWESIGKDGFVSVAKYPETQDSLTDSQVEAAESYLENVLQDINEILKVTGIVPKRAFIYTTPEWKKEVYSTALGMAEKNELTIPALTKRVMSKESIRKHGKEAPDYVRKLAEDLMKRSSDEIAKLKTPIEEHRYLEDAIPFLTKEFGSQVEVLVADAPGIFDPQRKARVAQPLRPAIYVE